MAILPPFTFQGAKGKQFLDPPNCFSFALDAGGSTQNFLPLSIVTIADQIQNRRRHFRRLFGES